LLAKPNSLAGKTPVILAAGDVLTKSLAGEKTVLTKRLAG
jgi:hypothetical protein|tara:strand:+ start:72 stop:191 length:120 start_codon:yes stop_codon:yes gene_type:complete